MNDTAPIDDIIKKHKIKDYKWLLPKDIIVAQWVRFKCMFGCSGFGVTASCPPNTPPIPDCREFINEYKAALIFHFQIKLDDPETRHEYCTKLNKKLLKLEREIFLAGYYKTFLLFMDECALCDECTGVRETCLKKEESRPTAEGLGVDVYQTAHNCGYPIEVLKDYDQEMNRYAFILVE